jgi:hypothetical protein
MNKLMKIAVVTYKFKMPVILQEVYVQIALYTRKFLLVNLCIYSVH